MDNLSIKVSGSNPHCFRDKCKKRVAQMLAGGKASKPARFGIFSSSSSVIVFQKLSFSLLIILG